MKKKFTFLIAALALLAVFALPMKGWANDQTLFDVTTASNWETSCSTYSSTIWSSNGCIFVQAANNNKGFAWVRLGGKNLSQVDAYIATTTATTIQTKQLDVTVAQAYSNSGLTIHSITLYVYGTYTSSNNTYSNEVEHISYDVSDYAAGTMTFEPSNADYWDSGVYFKLVYNVSNSSTSKNYGTDVSKLVAVEYTGGGGGGGSTPTITVSKNSLSGFTYSLGNGPSTAQTFKVSGSNLEDNITLALNDENDSAFEISLSENSDYSNTLTLTQTSGTVDQTTVYVRMKADLTVLANGYADEINLSSTTASAAVNLSGSVTPPSVTWDLTTAQFSSQSSDLVTWTDTHATMTVERNGSNFAANAYLGGTGSYNNTHFYSNHILTISPAPHWAISKIEITATSTTYATSISNATWSNATASVSGSVVTLTPSNGDLDVSTTFSGTVYVTEVKVYYAESTAPFFNITVNGSLNGSVVANCNEAIAGKTITLSIYPDAGYCIEASNISASGATVTKVNASTFTFTMPANNVTVNAVFSVYDGTYYTLVTSTDDLLPGRKYIIASSKTNGAAYVMGAQSNTNYRSQVAAVVAGTMIYETTGVAEIVLSGDATNHWTMYDENTPGYLYAASSNYLKTQNSLASIKASEWSVSFTNEGDASIVSYITTQNVSNTIRHNPGSTRFSCYTPTNTMAPVYLYMKANETACKLYSATTIAKEVDCATCDLSHTNATLSIADGGILDCSGTITGATTSNLIIEDGGQLVTSNVVAATVQKNIGSASTNWETASDGWHFIASPVSADVNPTTVSMITDNLGSTATTANATYDLYYLDPTVEKAWKNYRNSTFNLVNGKGYLYASKAGITPLSIAGEVKAYTAPESVDVVTGWNLIGNPFTFNVYASQNYYKMNENGTAITPVTKGTETIAPCTGIVVQADSDGSVTFSKEAPAASANNGNVEMVLTQTVTTRGGSNAETLDNAIVSFNEGSQLEKFYFGTQNANIYIPQGNDEYAIVSAEARGEMPVSFKANQNGQYTITVNTEDVEMGYLHLVDNMTGADIDLLATPSYTFNARTDDYTSRFKLVFSANGLNNENGNDDFAFLSNGQLIIANDGEATLQVVDITGRVLSSEVINGSCTKNIDAATGVYVLRLVNGSNVKTQKVIIK